MFRSLSSLFLGLLVVGLQAQSVGKLVYFEGDIKIVRNERVYTAADLEFGDPIENYDMISTGARSLLEISLNPNTGVAGNIKLSPSSSFYLELSPLQRAQTAGVELVAGKVALNISRMSGSSGLQVRTGGAVMGVRGTQFNVSFGAGGETLVATSEGKVEVTNDDGKVLFSTPGSVVEVGERFRSIPVAVSSLENFEKNWGTERIEALKGNAGRAIVNFAARYDKLYADFNRAMDRLNREKTVLNKWKDEHKRGTIGSMMDINKEKKVIVPHLLSLRKTLFMFERIYFRLTELKEYSASVLNTPIRRGYTVGDFYKQFDKDAGSLAQQMATVRFVMKLYSDRNEGKVPSDSFGDDFEFDDSESFFD